MTSALNKNLANDDGQLPRTDGAFGRLIRPTDRSSAIDACDSTAVRSQVLCGRNSTANRPEADPHISSTSARARDPDRSTMRAGFHGGPVPWFCILLFSPLFSFFTAPPTHRTKEAA